VQEKAVPSPCIGVCALNENDICVGCYRSVDELSHWDSYSNVEKKQVILKTAERAREANAWL